MLTRKQKKEIIENLSKEIKSSQSVLVCDFKGLTVADLGEIRSKLREKGASMFVTKKTLAQIAFKEAGIEMATKLMEGQLAFIYGGEDETCSAKILNNFSKTNNNLKILSGTLEGGVLTDKEIINLAQIPSRQELLTKLVCSIKSPISGMVGVLSGNLRNFVGVLNAIKESK